MDLRNLLSGPSVPSAITLTGLDGKPVNVSHEQLAQMDQMSLLGLRKINKDPDAQDLLAGYEHRSAAREAGAMNPLMGASYGVAVPMYQLAKALPRAVTGLRSRSSPSLSQLRQGLTGAGEGIVQGMKNWIQ